MQRHHRAGMQTMCEASRADIMKMMQWYVVRERDGAYLGFRPHPSGQAKVLAVAHVDYLRSGVVHKNNRKVIVSSALDDRAGVYIALNMLDDYGIVADVLLTDEEESSNSTVAMIGAGMLQKYNWIVQLDRRGTDVVTYGYTELAPKLSKFWDVQKGSFSDIAYLEDINPVSAFNLGVGYHKEHSEDCHLIYRQLHRQLCKLREFYDQYRDVRMERKHFAGELYDVPPPPPPPVKWHYQHNAAIGFKPDEERCSWCTALLSPYTTHDTTWGSKVCSNCYHDWMGDDYPKEQEKLVYCTDCKRATYYPAEVKGQPYCVDCAGLARVMCDPFGVKDD